MKIDSKKFMIVLARNSMNISDLAVASNVSANTINSWIKKRVKRNPTTKSIGKVAKGLNCDVTELIEE